MCPGTTDVSGAVMVAVVIDDGTRAGRAVNDNWRFLSAQADDIIPDLGFDSTPSKLQSVVVRIHIDCVVVEFNFCRTFEIKWNSVRSMCPYVVE